MSHNREVLATAPGRSTSKKIDVSGKYAFFGDGWTFCGETSDTLPAGIYRAEHGFNTPLLKIVDLNTDSPVVIPGSIAERISKEVSHFWSLAEQFATMGVLHKRGILMFGPPGSGKTSTAISVARQVVEDGGVVFVLAGSDFVQLRDAIRLLRIREPNRPVLVLFEDIDELVEDGYEEVLLSFLDGEDQVNHIAILATTNSLEKMGDRIRNRPCRFDVVVEVGMPSLGERVAYLFARLKDEATARKWAADTEGLSLAHLREMVVAVKCMGEDELKVLERLRNMSTRKEEGTLN